MYSAPAVGSVYWHSTRLWGRAPARCFSSSGPVENRTRLAMHSTPAVECVCCPDEGIVREHSLRVFPFHHGTEAPAGFEPARSCDHKVLMYSNVQSGCIQKDRRGCDQRRYGALPLELRRCVSVNLRRWDSNPQHPDFKSCTPNRQSISLLLVATKFWVRGFTELPRIEESWAGVGPATSRTTARAPTMYSEPAVAVVSMPNEVVAKSCFRYGRPYQQRESLIVDWPLHLTRDSGAVR